MSQKYVESLPLYRQEKQFERLGVQLLNNRTFGYIEQAERDLLSFYTIINQPEQSIMPNDS